MSADGGRWRRSVAVLAALLAGACLPRYHVRQTHDPFLHQRGARMESNLLAGPRAASGWLQLNAEVTRQGPAVACSLRVVYHDRESRLNIPRGETLLVLADTEVTALSGRGSRGRRRTSWLRVARESAVYSVAPEQLRRMAAAHELRVRLLGTHEYVERSFSKKNLERLRSFVSVALDGQPARPAPAKAAPTPPGPGAGVRPQRALR